MSKEYPCVYHANGECKKFSGDGITSYCVLGPCPDETPSNADRIRAMSDIGMAKWLLEFVKNPPKGSFLDYLQQPAEGGE